MPFDDVEAVLVEGLVNVVRRYTIESLSRFQNIAETDLDLFKHLMELNWLEDGLSGKEYRSLLAIESVALKDTSVALTLAKSKLITGKATSSEELSVLSQMERSDIGRVELYVHFPWLNDGVTRFESAMVRVFENRPLADILTLTSLMSTADLRFGLNRADAEAMSDLLRLDIDTISELAALPWANIGRVENQSAPQIPLVKASDVARIVTGDQSVKETLSEEDSGIVQLQLKDGSSLYVSGGTGLEDTQVQISAISSPPERDSFAFYSSQNCRNHHEFPWDYS